MDAVERHRAPREWAPGPPPGHVEGGEGSDAAREAGERFLRAGDRALDRALSKDSESFLRASRQEGGE
jgi:hypothetical protein